MNASNGNIPENAWNAMLGNGEVPLYIARAEGPGTVVPGTLMSELGVVRVPATAFYEKAEYQVLVKNPTGNCVLKWVRPQGEQDLSGPRLVKGGYYYNSYNGKTTDLYICKVNIEKSE